MNIHVYTICYNEEFFLPYFLRHYSRYASKIIMYDNESTDNSVAIAKSAGCEVLTYTTNATIRDDLMLEVKNNCWKASKGQNADWVIVVDIDELLYHVDLPTYLTTMKDYTVLQPQGYQMISENLPTLRRSNQIYDTHKHGSKSKYYSKQCIFKPDAIDEIDYTPGCHKANPSGNVNIGIDDSLLLLHYSKLSLSTYLQRMKARKKRLSATNIENKWGTHYRFTERRHRMTYRKELKKAKQVIP